MAFTKTVSAISYSIVRARCEPDAAELTRRHPDIVRFVVDQQGRMPDYMRLPFKLLTVLFDLCGLAHGGRPFHSLTHPARWRQIESWRRAPFAPARDFVRFYESLAVYRWYCDDEPRAGRP